MGAEYFGAILSVGDGKGSGIINWDLVAQLVRYVGFTATDYGLNFKKVFFWFLNIRRSRGLFSVMYKWELKSYEEVTSYEVNHIDLACALSGEILRESMKI